MILPANWTSARIFDLFEINPKHAADLGDDTEVGFVPMSAVDEVSGRIEHIEVRPLGAVRKGYTHFAEGDVIFAKITPCMENGNCAIASNLPNGLACGSTEFFVFRTRGGVEPGYLYRFLRQQSLRNLARKQMNGAVGQARVPREFMESLELPVPPLNEQRRIVSKLDTIFAQTRAAKARLERLPALLDKLRRSILAAAFRGDLTADWRADNPDTESAGRLIERVRAERRAWWEHDCLVRARARGRQLEGDAWRSKYEPSARYDGEGPWELPKSWAWVQFGECVVDSLYGPRFPASDYSDTGVPTIRTTDMTDRGQVVMDNPPRVVVSPQQLAELGLENEDLVVTRTGATIGKCALYSSSMGSALPSAYLIRFRLTRKALLPRYALLFLLSPAGHNSLVGGATATAQPNVNARTVSAIPMPLAPRAEQEEVAKRVARMLAIIDRVEAQVGHGRVRVMTLEMSVLARAFCGELVPQNPNDEPAAVLLDCIRAVRADASEGFRRGATRRTDAPTSVSNSNGHRTTANSDDSLDLVVAALQQGEPRVTAADIAEATNLDASAVKQVLKTLVAAGQVRVHGKARGTSYEWIA